MLSSYRMVTYIKCSKKSFPGMIFSFTVIKNSVLFMKLNNFTKTAKNHQEYFLKILSKARAGYQLCANTPNVTPWKPPAVSVLRKDELRSSPSWV